MVKTAISVILPAYNESKNLPIVIHKISRAFRKIKVKGEVILVDDGSKDDTLKVAKRLKKKFKWLRVLAHPTNMGLSKVLTTAFRHVRGEVIIFIPSDLQSDPEEDIPKLLNKLNEGYDLVCGWRKEWNRPWIKMINSKIYSFLSSRIFKVNIHDFNWIRAFKRKIIEDIPFLRKGWHRYFVVLIANKGYKIGEVKVKELPRKGGKSSFKELSRVFTGFFDLLVVKFYLSFREKPIVFFSVPGSILILLSFILGSFLFLDWMRGIKHFQLYLIDLVLFLTGIQLFAMGFLAELIATIKEELSNRK